MFFGTVPTQCIQQVLATVPFDEWSEIYVCCSGSFKVDQALRNAYPEAILRSNDVSLFSAALGRLLTDTWQPVTFVGELSFIEEQLADWANEVDRVAAIIIAHEMSRFIRNNDYARRHYAYYQNNFLEELDKARDKILKIQAQLPLDSFYCGDWLEHADAAMESGAGIVAFPPFFKGDYEKNFKFLHDNTEWNEPDYELYNPENLASIVDKFAASGSPYCVLTDQVVPGHKPVIEYIQGRKVPHYCYASTDKRSIRHLFNVPKPFHYKPIELDAIHRKSKCEVVPADAGTLNYIKDMFLAKSIIHSPGMLNYVVYIDGMLVGGIIYEVSKYGLGHYPATEVIYLLSDVTVTREGRLSKLVALLATSRDLIRDVEVKLMCHINLIATTARTKKPVSMKYRGIYKKMTMREDDNGEGYVIMYGSEARDDQIKTLYKQWYDKYFLPTRDKPAKGKSAA